MITDEFFRLLNEYNNVLKEQSKDLAKSFSEEITNNFLKNNNEVLVYLKETETSVLLNIAVPKYVDLDRQLRGNTLILLQEHGLIRKFTVSQNAVLCNDSSKNQYKSFDFLDKKTCIELVIRVVNRVINNLPESIKSSVLQHEGGRLIRHIGYNVSGLENNIEKQNIINTIIKEIGL